MDGTSLDVKQNDIETLRKLFPHVFSEDKIDFEKFQAAFTEKIYFSNERYTLNWAGKSDAFKILQEGTTATLKPQPELSVNFDTSENVFIEGENLEVLKILQKSYYNKIKCIIIDPPYNTGSDSFIYPDRFKENLEDYEKRVGERDEEGYLMKEGLFRKNSRENGHYHSNWLNMMLPRLFLARNLLRDDGVIFVHIDDNEVHNLRLLMNEIFGEENFVGQIVWQKKYAATNDSKGFSTTHDYILVFQKSESFKRNLLPRTEEQNKPYKNDDNDGKGLWRADNILVKTFSKNAVYPIINPNTKEEFYPPKGSSWRANKETMDIWIKENRIFFGKDGKGAPQLKRYLNEVQQGKVPITWWSYEDAGHNDSASRELGELFDSKTPFDTPKPTKLIKLILQIGSNKTDGDIILDFFAGSATTAHAVLDLNKEDNGNRKFILVQLPELCNEDSEAYKAGYKTIADISRERIRRVGRKVVSDKWLVVSKKEKARYGCKELSRADCLAESNANGQASLFVSEKTSESGNVLAVGPDTASGGVDSVKHSGRAGTHLNEGISTFSGDSQGFKSGIGNTTPTMRSNWLPCRYGYFGDNEPIKGSGENAECPHKYTNNCPLTANHYQLTTNHSDIGFRSYKLSPSNFKIWRSEEITEENLEKQMEMFIDPVKPESIIENMLVELMLKSGYQLTDNVENKGDFYYINNELVIALTKMDLEIAAKIIALQPQKVITLDRLFAGNDELKTNTALQMRDAGVELRVV